MISGYIKPCPFQPNLFGYVKNISKTIFHIFWKVKLAMLNIYTYYAYYRNLSWTNGFILKIVRYAYINCVGKLAKHKSIQIFWTIICLFCLFAYLFIFVYLAPFPERQFTLQVLMLNSDMFSSIIFLCVVIHITVQLKYDLL